MPDWLIYTLAPFTALGAYHFCIFINNEFIKPKPSYSWMFQGLRGPQNLH